MSNASDSSVKYEPSLVTALFLRVLEQKYAKQLMDRINKIMSAEIEHQNKMGAAGKKGPRVNQVGTASAPSDLTQ